MDQRKLTDKKKKGVGSLFVQSGISCLHVFEVNRLRDERAKIRARQKSQVFSSVRDLMDSRRE